MAERCRHFRERAENKSGSIKETSINTKCTHFCYCQTLFAKCLQPFCQEGSQRHWTDIYRKLDVVPDKIQAQQTQFNKLREPSNMEKLG